MSGKSNDTARELLLMTRPPDVALEYAEPLIVWMSSPVAVRLRALGFEQPVQLDALPGKWWSIRADLAALGFVSEPGCGFARTTASTEAIAGHFCLYWRDIQAGPFDCAEDSGAVYLAAPDAEVAWLGDGATVVRVPSWISRRLIERGLDEPVPLRKLAGKYWVCGLGGGSCSTAELEDRLRRDPASVNITHGPFDREEDAQYAFDLMWESPE